MAVDDGFALDSVCVDPASPSTSNFKESDWSHPAVQAEIADSRRKVRRIVGTFLILSVCTIVVSMVVDSYDSRKSEQILLREGNLEVSKIVHGPKHGGGMKALKKFVGKMVSLGEKPDNNATKTGDAEEAPEGGNSTAAAPEAESTDEGESDEVKKEDKKASIKTEPREGNDGAPGEVEPGWTDKSGWDSGDWAVWVLMGPCVTLAATMFMYYTYGFAWALCTLGSLLVIDALAYYLNV